MDREEHRQELLKFIEEKNIEKGLPKEFYLALSEALYSFNETGIFGDNKFSSSDALMLYALVKTLFEKPFPKDLIM